MPDPIPLPGLLPTDLPAEGFPVVECDDCREELHDRISRAYRLGPRCRRKRGIRIAPGVGRFEVEQEGLFGG